MRIPLLPIPFLLLLAAPATAQFWQPVPGQLPSDANDQIVFDPLRRTCVALAGNTTWIHDGWSWHTQATAQTPIDRYEHAMVFDGSRVLVYGGQDANGPGILSDFWAFDGQQWTQLNNGNTCPGPRRGHAMAFDAARNKVVLYGGSDMTNFPSDTWEWDGSTWTSVSTWSPGSRVWHRMTYDPLRSRVVMVGGAMNPIIFDDTWEFDGNTWVQTVTHGAPTRFNGGLVYDLALQRTLLVGGWDPMGLGMIVQTYDPASASWSTLPVPSANQPGDSLVFAAAYDPWAARTIVLNKDSTFWTVESRFLYSQGTTPGQFTTFGQGCTDPATNTAPVIHALHGALPVRGAPFGVEVRGLSAGCLSLLATGFSNSSWNGLQLPFDLQLFGMPGCRILASWESLQPMATAGNLATWATVLPSSPALAGVTFRQQAIVLVPAAANGIGVTSNASTAVIQ